MAFVVYLRQGDSVEIDGPATIICNRKETTDERRRDRGGGERVVIEAPATTKIRRIAAKDQPLSRSQAIS